MAVVPMEVLNHQMGQFWKGADGNVYVAGDQGVNSAKAWDDGSYNYWTGLGYEQIADPSRENAGMYPGMVQGASTTNSPAPNNPNGGSGTAKVFNQAGASNTQRTIDEIPGLLEAALASERATYGNTVNDFNTQEAGQRKTYDTSTVTNQQNYDANFMDSIRSGIKGLGGLMALLRGTGAGGGTAEDMARDTVGGVTANDIRTGADTQKENQIGLDGSLSTFLSDLKRKRDVNEDTRINNERAIRRDSDTQLQDLFGKMAGFYGDVGNTAEATNWMNRGGDLTPGIAQNSRTQVSAYDTAPVTVKAPELSAFAAPTQPSIQTAPNGQIGSGLFTMSDSKRRKEQAPIPVGV